jgi:predicted ATPase
MLTRLRIKGFKNLHDVDVAFGPFTCIAGPNGVGKSNLFDAIALLSALAAKPILEALMSVRGTNGRVSEIGRLFSHRDGEATKPTIEIAAELLVPRVVRDDFDREAEPTATLLEYQLSLCYDPSRAGGDKDPVYLEREELRAKSSSDAARWLPFHPSAKWIQAYVMGPGSRTSPFIETVRGLEGEAATGPTIKLYGERKSGGRPATIPARKTPQTVVSGVNSITHPTALAVRNEMRNWRMLQLEPSALRRPDELHGNPRISATGEHLPSAVLRIDDSAEIARRLSELIPGVLVVEVDIDPARQTRTLMVRLRDRRKYSASSLSDGTLRFLALAILASDPEAAGLICMEEPENGIHPKRIPAMLDLVRALAGDEGDLAVEPMPSSVRQVLINTHSPLLVRRLPDESLLVAETVRFRGTEFVNFKPLPGTWRSKQTGGAKGDVIGRGELEGALGYENVLSRGPTIRRVVEDHLTADLFPLA